MWHCVCVCVCVCVLMTDDCHMWLLVSQSTVGHLVPIVQSRRTDHYTDHYWPRSLARWLASRPASVRPTVLHRISHAHLAQYCNLSRPIIAWQTAHTHTHVKVLSHRMQYTALSCGATLHRNTPHAVWKDLYTHMRHLWLTADWHKNYSRHSLCWIYE